MRAGAGVWPDSHRSHSNGGASAKAVAQGRPLGGDRSRVRVGARAHSSRSWGGSVAMLARRGASDCVERHTAARGSCVRGDRPRLRAPTARLSSDRVYQSRRPEIRDGNRLLSAALAERCSIRGAKRVTERDPGTTHEARTTLPWISTALVRRRVTALPARASEVRVDWTGMCAAPSHLVEEVRTCQSNLAELTSAHPSAALLCLDLSKNGALAPPLAPSTQLNSTQHDIGASVKAAAAVANRCNLYLRTTPTGTRGPALRVPRRSGPPPLAALGGRGEPRGPALFESEA